MSFFPLIILILPLLAGCASELHEVITCTPPHADIYWGPTPSDLKKTGHKTPFSRKISEASWENWCYQVKKDGYHDSEIVCREKEKYRYINFNLTPMMTTTSAEPAAVITSQKPSEEKLEKTKQVMPQSESVPTKKVWRKVDSPQVKKEKRQDSKIASKPQVSKKEKVPSKPRPQRSKEQKVASKPKPHGEHVISGRRVTLAWDDSSSDEVGFEVERKEGTEGVYRKIGTVGPNVTEYTDNGLIPATTYYYRVRAYDSQGRYSAYSKELRVETSPQ